MSEKYPRFISKIPAGEDRFPSGAPGRTADIISRFLEDGDKHVIGLDGGWGSGKSNILKMVDKSFSDSEHLMFT